jgi:hypothetical protein
MGEVKETYTALMDRLDSEYSGANLDEREQVLKFLKGNGCNVSVQGDVELEYSNGHKNHFVPIKVEVCDECAKVIYDHGVYGKVIREAYSEFSEYILALDTLLRQLIIEKHLASTIKQS